ncbi:Haloacid Dehalogenase Superfamily Class (subfamily) IIA/FMN-dependent oxidoreductase, nitrilotriacetate monooxygenase family [Lentzea xinjiangensis]|uniref:Haloacid Dehalogenase Superfamily Class (Subfamily) IIA/FMN-dependent oxidoreductase, nitrilotriacetate monooxygenase family n=1 Tax=Lentzea xinjiangensis TaxID=402600 RepID=A0A1H9WQF7_9PSEU|nr:NtaA/DmoA family FMN-dependent monooxygenase [Lentzea xinjiangensis]SES36158.1 Haloacid Dehalogenase Superfamily Class (subfamily) IIA/FMN-dependent oxidoreductase, nitrilotriacetate monooxygenase family [Lentzea xinjiangensis]
MHLGVVPLGSGGYGQHRLWRDPAIPADASVNLDWYKDLVQQSESAAFDFVFLADSLFVGPQSSPHSMNRFEPFTLLSALATHTRRIGLVATASTSYNSPFNLARRIASLDLLSGGRAGWNVVTTGDPGTAANFSRPAHYTSEERYERAHEYVDVVRGLWDSYEDDAFLYDKEHGRFADLAKQHALNHAGRHFTVAGPLNIQRSRQGHPVLFQAGDSVLGRDLGACVSDAVFTNASRRADLHDFSTDMRKRVASAGRAPHDVLIFPSIRIVVGDTDAEARDLALDFQDRDHPFEESFAELRRWFGWREFDQNELDEPFPAAAAAAATNAYKSRAERITQDAVRNGLTLRQTVESLRRRQLSEFVGSPATVANLMQSWWQSGDCDGYILGADRPENFKRIATEVVPILQERGVFRSGYESETLRGNLGVPARPNRYSTRSCGTTDLIGAPKPQPPLSALVLDLDGVTWRGGKPVENIHEVVHYAEKVGLEVCFLTNNSSQSRTELRDRLSAIDIAVDPGRIFTAASITAAHLAAEAGEHGYYVTVGGGPVLLQELRSAGLTADSLADYLASKTETSPRCTIVTGYMPEFGYSDMAQLLSISNEIEEIISTERDQWARSASGPQPASAWFVAGIEETLDKCSTTIGKPSAIALETVARDLDVDLQSTLMVGDSLRSDIAAATNAGALSCHFKDPAHHVSEEGPTATYTVSSLAELRELIETLV